MRTDVHRQQLMHRSQQVSYKINRIQSQYKHICICNDRRDRKATIKSEAVTELSLPTVNEGFTTTSSTDVSPSMSSSSSDDDDDDDAGSQLSSGSTSSEVRLDSAINYYSSRHAHRKVYQDAIILFVCFGA